MIIDVIHDVKEYHASIITALVWSETKKRKKKQQTVSLTTGFRDCYQEKTSVLYQSAKGCWEAQGHLKHVRQDGGSSVASFLF